MEQYLSVKEAAPILGVAEDTLRGKLQAGIVPGYKMEKLWRIRRDELEEYMAKSRNIPKEG